MKELSIEEKAKAYDEAFRIAQELYSGPNSSNIGKGYVCTIFPELRESEGEKIRKRLITAFGTIGKKEWGGLEVKDILAWLEKQDEQKLLNNDKYQTVSVEILDRLYESEKELEQLKQREQKPANNILEAWKDMRLEVYQQASGNRHESNYSDDATKMFSLNDIDEIIEKMSEQKPADWSEEDEKMLNQIVSIIEDADDYLIRAENISIYTNWLKSLKDRVQSKHILRKHTIFDQII